METAEARVIEETFWHEPEPQRIALSIGIDIERLRSCIDEALDGRGDLSPAGFAERLTALLTTGQKEWLVLDH